MRTSSCIPLVFCCTLLWCAASLANGELSQECTSVLQHYLHRRVKEAAPYRKENLLYFLHVPRTAGRTFHTCLLQLGTQPQLRCPKSYDALRVDQTTKCHLLSSHDDFSVVDILPHEVSVVSQIRDPVDRILSAYEFAVEVAARSFDRPPSNSTGSSLAFGKKRVATEMVWPWSVLVPFFTQDMAMRKAKLQHTGTWLQMSTKDGRQYLYNRELNMTRWPNYEDKYESILPQLDPYDNPLFMPLAEFIQQPIAQELLHDGTLLQILGLTNYSRYEEAPAVRSCLFQEPDAHAHLLHRALKRLETFTHVGTTDMLEDSVTSAAASIDMRLDGPSYRRPSSETLVKPSRRLHGAQGHSQVEPATQDALSLGEGLVGAVAQHAVASSARGRHLLVPRKQTLAFDYRVCVGQAKDRNQRRRNQSLKHMKTPDGRGFRFSKEARTMIPAPILQAIRDRNKGDLVLYQKAKQLLAAKKAEHIKAGKLQRLRP